MDREHARRARFLARLGAAALLGTLAGCASTPSSPSPAPAPALPLVAPAGLSPWQRVDWLAARRSTADGTSAEASLSTELGRAYLDVGRPARAREFFRRSQYRDPDGSLTAANERGLGESYLREGNPIAAEPHLARAIVRSASVAERDEALLLQSIALARLGRSADAEATKRRIERPDRASLALLESSVSRTDAAPLAASPSPTPARPAEAAPSGFSPIARKRWGPKPTGRNVDPMDPPTRITVHHSATFFGSTSEGATAAEIRGIQRVHQETDGWADIGYHFVIDRAGRVWEGRPLSIQGAHAGNGLANRGNIGICLLGNFEVQPIAPKQAVALEATLRHFTERYRIPASRVYTHREIRSLYRLRATECPGSGLQSLVEAFRGGPPGRSARSLARAGSGARARDGEDVGR